MVRVILISSENNLPPCAPYVCQSQDCSYKIDVNKSDMGFPVMEFDKKEDLENFYFSFSVGGMDHVIRFPVGFLVKLSEFGSNFFEYSKFKKDSIEGLTKNIECKIL